MGGFSVLAGGSRPESKTSSGNDCCWQKERRCGRFPAADKAPSVDAAVSSELDGVFTLEKQAEEERMVLLTVSCCLLHPMAARSSAFSWSFPVS